MPDFWSGEACEARRLSVGAVHVPPPETRGVREWWAARQRRKRAWKLYISNGFAPWVRVGLDRRDRKRARAEWESAYAAGKRDLDTGELTPGAAAENMAVLGGPFLIPDRMDALDVDRALSKAVREPAMPDGTPWEDGGGRLP